MLNSLLNLRLSARKRGSASLEDSTSQGTPPPEVTPKVETPSPREIKSLPSTPRRKPRSQSKPRASLPPAVPDPPEKVALDALVAIIKACPPKSFQNSLLSRLQGSSPEQVSSLALLLDGLDPPPKLHCARCHLDYFEEENLDRSCVMDHDDNSTEVAHGETTWGCCDTTVDGMEPPAGWCYEGKHTHDRAKARYRKDHIDDDEEDGLQTCKERKCKRRPQEFSEVHVVITRQRSSRAPPSKKKRLS